MTLILKRKPQDSLFLWVVKNGIMPKVSNPEALKVE